MVTVSSSSIVSRSCGCLPMIDLDQDLPQDEIDKLTDSIARDVVRRRLETPAILFLETHKPLSFVASQALVVGTPFLGALFGVERMNRYSGFLRSRENVEGLVRRIEELVAERDKPQPSDTSE
jgi:hypothetical protein